MAHVTEPKLKDKKQLLSKHVQEINLHMRPIYKQVKVKYIQIGAYSFGYKDELVYRQIMSL